MLHYFNELRVFGCESARSAFKDEFQSQIAQYDVTLCHKADGAIYRYQSRNMCRQWYEKMAKKFPNLRFVWFRHDQETGECQCRYYATGEDVTKALHEFFGYM